MILRETPASLTARMSERAISPDMCGLATIEPQDPTPESPRSDRTFLRLAPGVEHAQAVAKTFGGGQAVTSRT
jgi:hypothetical protein